MTTLYDLSVGTFSRIVSASRGVLAKGREFADANGRDPNELVGIKMCDDMLPLLFQIYSIRHQSVGAIKALETGEFGPPSGVEPVDYAGLEAILEDAETALTAATPDEINGYAGKAVIFRLSGMEVPFTAENFILSFALPNFYFHATTAYDLLRREGVELSKRDFLGQLAVARG